VNIVRLHKLRWLKAFLLSWGILAGPVGATSPSVFVFGADQGSSWWLQKAIIRPIGKAAYGFSLEAFNAARMSNTARAACFLEPVTRASFIGLFRRNQAEIDATWRDTKFDPFSQIYGEGTSLRFRAHMVIFSTCEDDSGGYALLLIDDQNKIAFIDEWEVESDQSQLRYIYPVEGGKIGLASCFMCGDKSTLYFDQTRKRFYWEYEGD
jgi:hypothetical protein